METSELLTMYRCHGCRKLVLYKHIFREGACKCGSRTLMGASPSNWLEHLKVLWWGLTER